MDRVDIYWNEVKRSCSHLFSSRLLATGQKSSDICTATNNWLQSNMTTFPVNKAQTASKPNKTLLDNKLKRALHERGFYKLSDELQSKNYKLKGFCFMSNQYWAWFIKITHRCCKPEMKEQAPGFSLMEVVSNGVTWPPVLGLSAIRRSVAWDFICWKTIWSAWESCCPPDVMVTSMRRKCGRGRLGCDGKLIWTELHKCAAAAWEKEKEKWPEIMTTKHPFWV